jgi:DNA-binding NtrC family response regulator
MPLTLVLAVGLDSPLLASQSSILRSAGYFITSAGSVRDAINHFREGDFDVVLLGDAIPIDSKERLTFLIRAFNPRIAVFCVADAQIRNDFANLMRSIGELVGKRARIPASNRSMPAA